MRRVRGQPKVLDRKTVHCIRPDPGRDTGIAHAIDRQTVIDLIMAGYGTVIGSHWPPVTPYYKNMTGRFTYDLEKAKDLMVQAGYPNGFEATIKLPAIYAYAQRAGEVIADMLGQIGIKLKIEVVEWGYWLDRVFKQKDFELTMIGHVEAWDIGIYANPDYYFQYDSPEFRDAYAKALKAPNEAEKTKWFGRCQEIVAEDQIYTVGDSAVGDDLVRNYISQRVKVVGRIVEGEEGKIIIIESFQVVDE